MFVNDMLVAQYSTYRVHSIPFSPHTRFFFLFRVFLDDHIAPYNNIDSDQEKRSCRCCCSRTQTRHIDSSLGNSGDASYCCCCCDRSTTSRSSSIDSSNASRNLNDTAEKRRRINYIYNIEVAWLFAVSKVT